MLMPVVTGALDTITKGFVLGLENLEIRGRVETIQTTTLSRSARILRSDLRRLAVTQTPVKDHQLIMIKMGDGEKYWKLEDKSKLSKLQHGWDRPGYWVGSLRHGETCGHLASCENPAANANVKNIARSRIIIMIWSTRILRRVLMTRSDLLSLRLQCNTTSVSWWEELTRSEIIMISQCCKLPQKE